MRLALGILLLALFAAACNRTPPPQLPVRGRVLVNGVPLRGGTVVFTPDPKRGTRGPISFAVLNDQGEFELANEQGPGAIAGWHRVTIAPPPNSEALIAGLERYRHPDQSGLEFEVRPSADNDFTVMLEWTP